MGWQDWIGPAAQIAGPLLQGVSGYQGARAEQGLTSPDYEARQGLMNKYMGFMEDPRSAYADDPALRQARENRMGDVRAGQLARTGGTRGGSYARQLMKEGSAFDRAAYDQVAKQYLMPMAALQPMSQQYASQGGQQGSMWDSIGGGASGIMGVLGNMDFGGGGGSDYSGALSASADGNFFGGSR